MITQSFFTNIAPIKDGAAQTLKTHLQQIGDLTYQNAYAPFQKLPEVHYCRWCVMDELVTPDGKPSQPMLLLQINFDGDIQGFIKHWATVWAQELDGIYGHCEGYPASPDVNSRTAYLHQYRQKELLGWTAFQGGTVKRIKQEAELQAGIADFLDEKRLTGKSPQEIYAQVKDFAGKHEKYAWALTPPPGRSFGWKLAYYSELVLILAFLAGFVLSPVALLVQGIGTLFGAHILPTWAVVTAAIWFLPIFVFLVFWILLAKYFENQDNKHIKQISSDPKPSVLRQEDILPQNQLTIYGTLKKPHWFRSTHLKISLFVARLSAKYRSTKGSLSGITTIHFGSWVLGNKEQNLFFLSNYDGGWESYLSEFIDFTANVMNLNFGNIQGYPRVRWLLWEGAHNEQNFKKVVRFFQHPCQVWYSAYPQLRAKNIKRNQQIRLGLSQKMNAEALENWLKLL